MKRSPRRYNFEIFKLNNFKGFKSSDIYLNIDPIILSNILQNKTNNLKLKSNKKLIKYYSE